MRGKLLAVVAAGAAIAAPVAVASNATATTPTKARDYRPSISAAAGSSSLNMLNYNGITKSAQRGAVVSIMPGAQCTKNICIKMYPGSTTTVLIQKTKGVKVGGTATYQIRLATGEVRQGNIRLIPGR